MAKTALELPVHKREMQDRCRHMEEAVEEQSQRCFSMEHCNTPSKAGLWHRLLQGAQEQELPEKAFCSDSSMEHQS